MPRAQSAAGIGFLPCAWTWPSSSARVAVPTWTDFLVISSAPGGRLLAAIRALLILNRSPRKVVQAPGAGALPRISRSSSSAGRCPVDHGVLDVDLRRIARSRRPAAAAVRRPASIASRVSTSKRGTTEREPLQQVAGRVVGPDGLGHRRVRRAGVELQHDPEGGRPGDLIAGQDRVLHRGGPAPGREQREVQVDPAVRSGCRARAAATAPRRPPPGSSRGRAR